MAAEQLPEEIFAGGAPHLADRQRTERGQSADKGTGVDVGDVPHAAMADGVVDGLASGCGQFDLTPPVQSQHQTATDHVAELAVGLDPIPGLADFGRESAPTQAGVFRNQPAQEEEFFLTNLSPTKTQ